jgi:DNA (cytosine-5)-methyltransferase 1
MKKKLLAVAEAAEHLGVSVDTIKRWEKKGLIRSRRSELNHRLFSFEELERLHKKYSGKHSENKFKVLSQKTKSGYTCIELFAGAGGTALGMENAGIEHVLLNEYDKDAVATLRGNFTGANVIHEDVRELEFRGLKADIVQGGFPCQAFSYAGNQRGFNDIRGTLFFEMARCINIVKPKIVVGENVRGLLNHEGGKTFQTILKILRDLGYNVAYRILRAQYLDVPQKRERLIIIGVRQDLNLPILFPVERDYTISLKEALENCPPSLGQTYSENKRKILDLVPAGGYWRDLPVKLQKEYMKGSYHLSGGKTGMARRLSWDEPSLTLTCAPAQTQTERCHPGETRPLTIREYARLQTFPDRWEFSGSITSQYRQIGNAVPVNMGYHIGRCLIHMLNKSQARDMEAVNYRDFFKTEQLTLF